MAFISEILLLLKTGMLRDNGEYHTQKKKNWLTFKLFLLTVFLTFISVLILYWINTFLKIDVPQNNLRVYLIKNSLKVTIIVCFIAPIYEEIIYRLLLKYTVINLSIFMAVLSFIFVGVFFNSGEMFKINGYLVRKLLYSLSIGIFVYKFINYFKKINEYLSDFWDTNPVVIFYISLFIFAFSHFFNYKLTHNTYFLLPLLLLPQIIGGVNLSYIRLKYGIQYSLTLHIVYNIFTTAPFIWQILLNQK